MTRRDNTGLDLGTQLGDLKSSSIDYFAAPIFVNHREFLLLEIEIPIQIRKSDGDDRQRRGRVGGEDSFGSQGREDRRQRGEVDLPAGEGFDDGDGGGVGLRVKVDKPAVGGAEEPPAGGLREVGGEDVV